MNLEKKKLVIIGGGAAGFFTAANVDGEKYDIHILEQASDVLQVEDVMLLMPVLIPVSSLLFIPGGIKNY